MTWLKSIYIVVYRKSEKYMKLIIVESPHKSETISKFLKQGDYLVKASKGQVEDLAKCAKNGFGVDVENDFKPTYVITSSQKQTVNDLKNMRNNRMKLSLQATLTAKEKLLHITLLAFYL